MDASKYAVNYNDERLTGVKNEQIQKEQETANTYNDMINKSDSFYQSQIDASKEWTQKQSEIQQANTDLAIERINQQKEQAEADYTKEQKASYSDYKKQTNDYGINAELMADRGLSNSGYSETAKVSMYNTYQNRVTSAKDSINRATLEYNNSIKEATLANNSKLAEISFNALQQQLEISLQGFQYKNSLIQTKEETLNSISDRYHTRYQDTLNQINAELERQKEVDTLNEQFEQSRLDREQRWRQIEIDKAQRDAELAISRQKADRDYQLSLQQMELERRKTALSERQYNESQVKVDDDIKDKEPTSEELISGIKWIAGANLSKPIYDKYSKKYFATVEEMLNYHGYAAVD